MTVPLADKLSSYVMWHYILLLYNRIIVGRYVFSSAKP